MGISAPAGSLREIRGLRGELGQFAKRMSENNSSLRSQIAPLRSEMRAEIRVLNTRIDAVGNQLNTHIDALGMQVNARIDELTQRLDDALNVRQCLIRNFRLPLRFQLRAYANRPPCSRVWPSFGPRCRQPRREGSV